MKRITKVFQDCTRNGTKAFVPYIAAGDPGPQKTAEILVYLATHGADIIEVGVPFSDPMADGPVIQTAMERALQAGTTLRKVLGMVKWFKDRYSTPIIVMGYYNPFYAYGIEEFARDARISGVDGVLTVDLPPEESKEFHNALRKEGIASIFLLTPVSDIERIRAVKKVAGGFVYFVSVTGVTGERNTLPEEIKEKMVEIKEEIPLPLVLGFGISGPDVVRNFYPYVDGFVVGSALIKRWVEAGFSLEKDSDFHPFYKSLVEACRGR
ncbi:MAG: Tryptophan synthase alpha chain [Syntrophorhabdus sp. PtaU1.Bin153]|nr:MAG: Tryptophan synthase alpha chain [Syntrophorhabdus sp. PtaU1.Bin153]